MVTLYLRDRDIMKISSALSLLLVLLLGGCNSYKTYETAPAAHEVVPANTDGDKNMTCPQIDSELARVQSIIDGVHKDENQYFDVKDFLTALLPAGLDLLADYSDQINQGNALAAANRRIVKLQELQHKKGCMLR